MKEGKERLLEAMIEYLRVLQNGRSIPDRRGHGTVQESKDNIEDIVSMKKEINSLITKLASE